MIYDGHVTRSHDAENLALITEINYTSQYIHSEKSYFKL